MAGPQLVRGLHSGFAEKSSLIFSQPGPYPRNMGALRKYWGYAMLLAILSAWPTSALGPGLLAALSALTLIYFAFRAPMWCGAVTRGNQLCRNNSKGLLFGCTLRQHKWQKLKMLITPEKWRLLNDGLWSSPSSALGTVGNVVSIVSFVAALVLRD